MLKKRHVALIGPYPIGRSPAGGVESVNYAMVQLLLHHAPDLEMDVLTVGDGEFEESHAGRLRVHAKLPADYRLANLRGFPKEAAEVEQFLKTLPDHALIHSVYPYSVVLPELTKQRNLPNVMTIHGLPERESKVSGFSPYKRWFSRMVQQRFDNAVKNATWVVAINQYSYDHVCAVGAGDHASIIPNPVDPRVETLVHRPLGERPRLLFAGVMQPRKGLHIFLDALPKVLETHPDLLVSMVGPCADQKYLETIKKQSEDMGLQNVVQWIGEVKREQLFEHMTTTDLVVLPSLEETMPQILQESAIAGVPFVATKVGGVPQLVPDDLVNQVLVDAGDANQLAATLSNLLQQPALRQSVAVRVKQHVLSLYSNQAVAEKMLALYGRLMAVQEHVNA